MTRLALGFLLGSLLGAVRAGVTYVYVDREPSKDVFYLGQHELRATKKTGEVVYGRRYLSFQWGRFRP